MFSSQMPPSLPSPDDRQACAKLLADPTGKGIYREFRVPDQAIVWMEGEPNHALSGKALVAAFCNDRDLVGRFWFVPREGLEEMLAVLHRALVQQRGLRGEKGLIGVWEAVLGDGEKPELLVGWVGSVGHQAGLDSQLAATGWEKATAGVRQIRFADEGPSPFNGVGLEAGPELSSEESDMLWGTMSNQAEREMMSGGAYLLDFLPLLGVLMVLMVAGLLVYPFIRDRNMLSAEEGRVKAVLQNIQTLSESAGASPAEVIRKAWEEGQGERVFPEDMEPIAGGPPSMRLSSWQEPVSVIASDVGPGFSVVYDNVPAELCLRLADRNTARFDVIAVGPAGDTSVVVKSGKLDLDRLLAGCTSPGPTIVLFKSN